LDGSRPPTQPDRDAVALLRRSSKPVLYVANKIDGQNKEWELSDHYALGVGDLIAVSALHGRHTGFLEAAIVKSLPKGSKNIPESSYEGVTRVALIGRPNAGKSSLFNRLAGTERSLVDNRPGTTRDPVDSLVVYKDQQYLFVDTAGVRRKSRVEQGVESQSALRSLRVINRADVIVLMSDVSGGVSDQDATLLGLAAERGRAIIVGLNKVDLLHQRDIKKAQDEAAHVLHFATWAPIVALSAHSGHGVGQLMKLIDDSAEKMQKRVGTSALNQFFEKVVAEHPPPTRGGKAPRIYYLTQTSVNPPTFVAFCSSPEHIAESYKRFLINRIRKIFEYESVPLRLFFRGKDRT
jgi:GTPase